MLGAELIGEITRTNPGHRHAVFWWLGQLGYAIKLAGRTIYIDAFLSPGENRLVPPIIEAAQVTNADLILGTHDHDDHIDRKSWPAMAAASPSARFVVPAMLADGLSAELGIPRSRIVGIEDSRTIDVDGIRITGIAAAHELLDRDEATGSFPYMGYLLQADGLSLYHSGDSCIYDGLAAKVHGFAPDLDAAFLPINGRDGVRYRTGCIGNMTFQEAVDLAGTLRPGLTVPGHYDMFRNNSEDPAKFTDYLDAKYPGLRWWVGAHGERVEI